MSMEDNQNAIIDVLKSMNWEDNGSTFSQSYRTGYRGLGHEVTTGGKPRFVSPNGLWKVGVGKRTTFFYKPKDNIERSKSGRGVDFNSFENWESRTFDTKDLSGIKAFLEEDTSRFEEKDSSATLPKEILDKIGYAYANERKSAIKVRGTRSDGTTGYYMGFVAEGFLVFPFVKQESVPPEIAKKEVGVVALKFSTEPVEGSLHVLGRKSIQWEAF